MDFNVKEFNVRLRTIRLRELAIVVVTAFILVGIFGVMFPIFEESDDLYFIVFSLLILTFFIFSLRGTAGLKKNISDVFEIKTRNEILYVFALNLLFAFLFTLILSGIDLLNGVLDPNWITGIDVDTTDYTSGALILELTATIIFAPIIEELVFRGVMFNRLKIRTGIIPAMLISSVLFAVGHDFGGMTSAFLFGICMCILYLKTDNILVPISVHFTNNAVATAMQFTQIDYIMSQMPWIIPFTLISLAATVLLIKYIVNELNVLKKSYN